LYGYLVVIVIKLYYTLCPYYITELYSFSFSKTKPSKSLKLAKNMLKECLDRLIKTDESSNICIITLIKQDTN